MGFWVLVRPGMPASWVQWPWWIHPWMGTTPALPQSWVLSVHLRLFALLFWPVHVTGGPGGGVGVVHSRTHLTQVGHTPRWPTRNTHLDLNLRVALRRLGSPPLSWLGVKRCRAPYGGGGDQHLSCILSCPRGGCFLEPKLCCSQWPAVS